MSLSFTAGTESVAPTSPETVLETNPDAPDETMLLESAPETAEGESEPIETVDPVETADPAETASPAETAELSPTTPVHPAEGTLSNVEFMGGSGEAGGVVCGRLPGSYPAGEGMTLQVLASAEDFAGFSRLSPEEYRRLGDTGDAFAAAMAGYDAAFFETHDLVVIRTGGGSGSLRFSARTETADGQTEITVTTRAPGACTMDLVFWAVLVPVEKGTTAEHITLRENTERYASVSVSAVALCSAGVIACRPATREAEEGIAPH